MRHYHNLLSLCASALLLAGCTATSQPTQEQVKQQFNSIHTSKQLQQHLQEWEIIKPQIEELLALKADLALLIDAIAKSSPAAIQKPVQNETRSPNPNSTMASIALHVGSFSDMPNAQRGWRQIQNAMSPLLSEYQPHFLPVQVNSVDFVSLRIGPFYDNQRAEALCEVLKKSDQYCALSDFSGMVQHQK